MTTSIAQLSAQPMIREPKFVADSANVAPDDATQVRDAFTSFVGETFFSQMIKAMRSSVGKPAYFHGGQAEEIFSGQLDQQLAEHMTKNSAEKFSEPMFRHQFPQLAEKLRQQQPAERPKLDIAG